MNETSSTIPENEISEASAEKTDEGASQDKASSMPEFKLERFDGPLDLLITLIARHKLDIYDIPIAQILEQYLDYLDRMKEADMEITSEFILMACELLYIKSKTLLPKEEKPEEDPRKNLVEALLEYSRVRAAALFLAHREPSYYKRYYATPKPFLTVSETPQMPANALSDALSNMRIALSAKKDVQKRKNVASVFSVQPISVEGKIIYLLRRMLKAIKYGNSVSFSGIFADAPTKRDAVATFLAMLELVQTGRLSYTHGENGDYIISLNTEKRKTSGDNGAPSEESEGQT
ncbi:MAG: hypothetical protein E7665_10225 [Ruminococcaceae bacterium]|nr:hypothetical protein [Oscillospiraceae bacterium]